MLLLLKKRYVQILYFCPDLHEKAGHTGHPSILIRNPIQYPTKISYLDVKPIKKTISLTKKKYNPKKIVILQ